jgi:hypothetical protein
MQKVEGSSPFIRSFRSPLTAGFVVSGAAAAPVSSSQRAVSSSAVAMLHTSTVLGRSYSCIAPMA